MEEHEEQLDDAGSVAGDEAEVVEVAPPLEELPTMFVPPVEAEPVAREAVAEETPDDDEDDKRKGMATSTKIVLIAAVWVLFTLFLVGRFSQDKPKTVSTGEFGAQTFDDGGTPDVIDTAEEEAADLNGDGVLDEGEKAAAIENLATANAEAAAAAEAAGDSGSGSGSSGGGYEGTPTDPQATPASPGAAPGGGATTTTQAAGGSSGGGATTTTPGATTTTKGPSNSTTTTVAPTTSAPGGGDPATTTPTGVDRTITVTGTPGAFIYTPQDFSIPAGSRVKMTNVSNKDHTWKIGSAAAIDVPKGGETAYHSFPSAGTFAYRCTIHSGMNGTITVT